MSNPFLIGWPYAAKAIIQHEFDTDHLNVYITFSEQMNTLVKPADSKWIVKLDTIETAIISSVWLDAYTMMLLLSNVVILPTRLTVAYDGPDKNLNISDDSGFYESGIKYGKQWNPWAAIPSTQF